MALAARLALAAQQSVGPWDKDTAAILARLSEGTNRVQKLCMDRLILRLKAEGLLAKLASLYLPVRYKTGEVAYPNWLGDGALTYCGYEAAVPMADEEHDKLDEAFQEYAEGAGLDL